MAWNIPGRGDPGRDSPDKGNSPRKDPWALVSQWLPGGIGPSRWIAAAVVAWLLVSCVVLVTEQQRAAVLRFGRVVRVLQPGPSLKLPWPIEHVVKVNATAINTYSDTVPVLTRDENIVSVEINVQYRISDPAKYLFGSRDANAMLQQAALSTVREQVGHSDLDTVLGARSALAVTARTQLQKSLDAYRTGITVTELNLPNARPPEEVKPAFDDVNSAQQDKDRLISEARAYAAKVVPEARGQAARTRTLAEGYKTSEIARATGDAARFDLLVEQYKAAPGATRTRLWLETVQDVLAKNRKIVGADSRQILNFSLPGNPQAAAAPVAPATTVVAASPADADAANPPRPVRSGRELDRGDTGR